MLPLAALAALALPLSTLAHGHHGHTHANSRKTLNFHPHPHRDGRTLDLSPHQADLPSGFAAGKAGRQAFVELARSALKDGEDGTDWFVRDDVSLALSSGLMACRLDPAGGVGGGEMQGPASAWGR